jgi:phosphonate transport system substrate-binding protein
LFNFSKYYNQFLVSGLLVFVLQSNPSYCQAPNDNVGYFQVAFSTNVFKGVYLNDAIAGAKILTEALIKEYSNPNYKVISPATFRTNKELEDLLKAQEVEVYILHPTELIKVAATNSIEPICVASRNGSPYETFYLLVNQNSKYKKIEDLVNKKILIGSPFAGDMPIIWLDQLLKQKKMKPKEKYFATIEYFESALPSILPVFFNNADACIVTKNLFETVVELNPQIKKELIIIESSEPVAIGIVAVRKNISDPELKTDVKDAFLNLHQNTNGRQYLDIFKIEHLIEFKEEYLQSSFNLLNIKK